MPRLVPRALGCVATALAVAAGVSFAVSAAAPIPQAAGRRLALVIGNDRYAGPMVLQNARRDAAAIAAELQTMGFQTTLVEDGTRARLIKALEAMATSLTSSDIVLFYYAGHGAQVAGENYLIPVDFTGTTEERLRLDGISATQIQTWLARARVSVLVFDACRNNPYAGQRSAAGGLAPMEARGSLVAFATGAGQTASDNPGGAQGTFTGALLEMLRVPGLPVREVFFRVRQRVHEISGGQQFPAVYDQLLGDVVLRPAANAPAATGSPAPAATRDSVSMRPGGSSSVPAWLIGDFRGLNAVTKTNIELTINADGTIAGQVGAGTSRATPVRYEWVGVTQQIRDPTGAYVFEVERSDSGFRMRQVGSPTNTVDYRRMYLPPASGRPADARAAARDLPRPVTPDELAALVAVVTEWTAAWERLDETEGRVRFPTWDANAVRKDRADKGVDRMAATVTCTSATIRRDQARLNCRASTKMELTRQAASRGAAAGANRPTTRSQILPWTVLLFWNGTTWLIESVS